MPICQTFLKYLKKCLTASIFEAVKRSYSEGKLTNGAAVASFLAVAEDVIFQLPKKDKRRYCWGYLALAYNDLYEIIDPDWVQIAMQDQGVALAEVVEMVAS